jgi:hypothetical protein
LKPFIKDATKENYRRFLFFAHLFFANAESP